MVKDDGSLKLSWREIFTDNTGRTSSSSFVGVVTSVACLILFAVLVVFYFTHPLESTTILAILDKTTIYFSIAAALMGVKSLASSFGKNALLNIGNMVGNPGPQNPESPDSPLEPPQE